MDKRTQLEKFAAQIRLETLIEFKERTFGHVGGAMSVVDLLSVLYTGQLKHDPKNPKMEDRDWLIMSKGHAGPSLYATLALKGFFPMEELLTLNKPGTNLPSHCDRNKTVGIDMTTGSLGQGISTALGVALGNKLKKLNSYVYLVLGDGECDEGQIWEGAMMAAARKADNLIVFVDYNKQQLDGFTKDILDIGDLEAKWASFGFFTQSIDGHDVIAIDDAINAAKANKGKPSAIILNTKKGMGAPFAEDIVDNHHMNFKTEQVDEAIERMRATLAALN